MSIDVSFRDLWHWIGYWKNQSQQLCIWEWRCQRVLDQPCKAIWLRTYSLFMKPLSFLLPRVSKLALQPLSARSLPWWWPWSKPSGDLTKAELMGPSDTLPIVCTLGEKNEEDTLDGTHPPVCLSWRLRVPGELRMEMWSRCCSYNLAGLSSRTSGSSHLLDLRPFIPIFFKASSCYLRYLFLLLVKVTPGENRELGLSHLVH